MLTARKLLQAKLRDIENSLRGILRGFGLKVGHTTAKSFARRIQELVAGHANFETIAQALLAGHAVLLREFSGLDKRARLMARHHGPARFLMTTPAIGPIIALTYAAAIDDPARFKSSKQTGAHFGLTPKKVSIRRKRLQRPDQQDRRCGGARSALSGRPRHAGQAAEGMHTAQKLGHAHRPPRRHAQGQGGAGAQARRDHASHAG